MKKNILITLIFFVNLFTVYNVQAGSIFEVKFKEEPDQVFRFSSLEAVESAIEHRYDLNINDFYKYTRQKNSDTVYNYQIKQNNYKIICSDGNARNVPNAPITDSRCYPNDGTDVFYFSNPPKFYNINDLIKEDEFKDYAYLRSFYFNYNLINIEEDIKSVALNTFYCDYDNPNFLSCEKAISNYIYDIKYDFDDYNNEMYIEIELSIAYKRNFLNSDNEDGQGVCNDIPLQPDYDNKDNCTQYTVTKYNIEMNFPEIEVIERKQSEYTDIPYEIIDESSSGRLFYANSGRIFYSKEICDYYLGDYGISFSQDELQIDIINEELFCIINRNSSEQEIYKPESDLYVKKHETENFESLDVLVLYDEGVNIEAIYNLQKEYDKESTEVFNKNNISNLNINIVDYLKIKPQEFVSINDIKAIFEDCVSENLGHLDLKDKIKTVISDSEREIFYHCINYSTTNYNYNFTKLKAEIPLKNNYINEYMNKLNADIFIYITNITNKSYFINHKGQLNEGQTLATAVNSPFSKDYKNKGKEQEGKKSLILENDQNLGFIINNIVNPIDYPFVFFHEIGHLLGNTHDPITNILGRQQSYIKNNNNLSCFLGDTEYKYVNKNFAPKYLFLDHNVDSLCKSEREENIRSAGFHKHSQGFYHYNESDLSGNSNWTTIMGYPNSVFSTERKPYFSSPDLICNSDKNIPCGKDKDSIYEDEKGYDVLSTIKVTYPLLSSIRHREHMDYKYKIQEVTGTDDLLLGTPFNDDLILGGGNDIVLSSKGEDKINFKDSAFNNDRFYISNINKIDITTITDLDLQDNIYIESNISYSIDYNNTDYIFIHLSDTQFLRVKKIDDDITLKEAECSYEECNFDGINYLKLQFSTPNNNNIYGDDSDNVLFGNDSNNTIQGGEGDDFIRSSLGYNYLYGDGGNDTLGNKSTRSDDWLGNDGEYDPVKNYGNFYNGGTGNDNLYGTRYGDTYYFKPGFGNDLILDYTNILENNENLNDIIRFGKDIFPFQIEITRTDTDVIIKYINDNSTITIKDSVNNVSNIIEYFFFEEDSTIWTWNNDIKPFYLDHKGTIDNDTLKSVDNEENILSGLAGSDSLYGANLQDHLYGNEGNDNIFGHYGNDFLYGNEGNDRLGSISKTSKDYLGNDGDFDPVNNFGQTYNGGFNS